MAKTYTLNSIAVHGGRYAGDDSQSSNYWKSYIQADSQGRWIGYDSSNNTKWRATNVLFNTTELTNLRSKTITSIKLKVIALYGKLPASAYTIHVRHKFNGTAYGDASSQAWATGNNGSYNNTDVGTLNNGSSRRDVVANEYFEIDVGTTIPQYGYVLGHVNNPASYMAIDTTAQLIVVTNETDYTLRLSYNANGGSGAPPEQTATVTTSGTPSYTFTIPYTIPARDGYTFSGWTDGSNTYQPGGSITITANKTLTAVWSPSSSVISTVSPGSVPIDGNTTVTVSITRYNSSYTHDVTFSLGTRSQTLTGQGTSVSFAIPTVWLDQLPAATSGTVTVSCVTKSGSTQVGNASTKTYTVTVPSSVKPTVTLTGTDINDNATLDSWNVLVAGMSRIKLTAAATAGTGSQIQTIAFSGDNVSQSGTGTTATSAILTMTGSRTWNVTVTDKRGRTATASVTKTVYEYANPTISNTAAYRSNSSGTAAPSDGTYITAKATFGCSSIGGNNTVTVRRISYKASVDSSYATGVATASDDTLYTFGAGGISTTTVYDVKYTVTDSIGSTSELVVHVQSISGIAFGLKNDRARFGGPVQKAGLQVDWNTEFNGVVDVTNRRCYATLSEAGWHRVLTIRNTAGYLVYGTVIKFNIVQYGDSGRPSSNHEITLSIASNGAVFNNELSNGTTTNVTKIRCTRTTGYQYVDIYVDDSVAHSIDVYFQPYLYQPYQERITSELLQSVADEPSGETVMATYAFENETVSTYHRAEASLSTTGWYRVLEFTPTSSFASYDLTGAIGALIKFYITRRYYWQGAENHEITLSLINGNIKFENETSNSSVLGIDKIRYTYNGTTGFVDIHYICTQENQVGVDFDVYCPLEPNGVKYRFLSKNLVGVADAPSDETVLTPYTFVANATSGIKVYTDPNPASYTIGSNHYASVSYPTGLNGDRVLSIGMQSWSSVSGPVSIMPYGDSAGTWYIIGDAGVTLSNVRFKYWYI